VISVDPDQKVANLEHSSIAQKIFIIIAKSLKKIQITFNQLSQ